MKVKGLIFKIAFFSAFFLIIGSSFRTLIAQEKNTPKKVKSKVEIKIITRDDEGTMKVTDTLFEVEGDVSDRVFIDRRQGEEDIEIFNHDLQHLLKNITVKINADSLNADSLFKEIEATLDIGEFPDRPMIHRYLNENDKTIPRPLRPGMQEFNWQEKANKDQFIGAEFPDLITPWGMIRKIKIKDKHNGKKVVIKTEDSHLISSGTYFPPKARKRLKVEKRRLGEE